MSNYNADGNRWTAVYLASPVRGGGFTYTKLPWELVRFNVDVTPDAPAYIVPDGVEQINASLTKPNAPKIYERIWITDVIPYSYGQNGKTAFGPPA